MIIDKQANKYVISLVLAGKRPPVLADIMKNDSTPLRLCFTNQPRLFSRTFYLMNKISDTCVIGYCYHTEPKTKTAQDETSFTSDYDTYPVQDTNKPNENGIVLRLSFELLHNVHDGSAWLEPDDRDAHLLDYLTRSASSQDPPTMKHDVNAVRLIRSFFRNKSVTRVDDSQQKMLENFELFISNVLYKDSQSSCHRLPLESVICLFCHHCFDDHQAIALHQPPTPYVSSVLQTPLFSSFGFRDFSLSFSPIIQLRPLSSPGSAQ